MSRTAFALHTPHKTRAREPGRRAAHKAFVRQILITQDELVAARWWHEAMTADPTVSRRGALVAFGVLGSAFLLAGVIAAATSADDETEITMEALAAQMQNGWNVGASDRALLFPGAVATDAGGTTGWSGALTALVSDLRPRRHDLIGYYVPTLLQSLAHASQTSLRTAMRPVQTAAMIEAHGRGAALRQLLVDGKAKDTAVIVDLPGPESVAFAAAMAGNFEPVFVFDNWPHPLGVVPAHLTLGAALYHRPTFVQAAAERPADAPPVFVLDGNRLLPYTDEAATFDNRHMARLPGDANLRRLGVARVLYVTNDPNLRERDDLNDDFVALDKAGIDVRLVSVNDFSTTHTGGSYRYYWGGSPTTHVWFWPTYGRFGGGGGFGVGSMPGAPPAQLPRSTSFRPQSRPTIFSVRSVGRGTGVGRVRPSGFGVVSVRASRSTGAVHGIGRSGSFGRSRSSFSG